MLEQEMKAHQTFRVTIEMSIEEARALGSLALLDITLPKAAQKEGESRTGAKEILQRIHAALVEADVNVAQGGTHEFSTYETEYDE